MTRALAVLRPEPGNAATAARVEALGLRALRLPLFAVRPLAWDAPDAQRFDTLLLTSANAIRHGGPSLSRYRALPVLAVGAATARAASDAGFDVALVGAKGIAALLANAGNRRALYLHAREASIPAHPAIVAARPVYASDPLPLTPEEQATISGTVALLHSVRAARRLALLLPALERAHTRIATLSPAIAAATGGWEAIAVAAEVSDTALLSAARALAD